MQVVVPMSGFGERFRRAGYDVPKPLIPVDGKPIIAHVMDLFPGERDVVFVCNQEHLDEPAYRMAEILREVCPTGRVVRIAPHRLGPVHAVMQVMHLLDPARPVVVNYCDFTCYWDWSEFRAFVVETGCAGAIPAYRGFHPHSLGSTFYAYLRTRDGWVEDIREKQPFTERPMEEFASSGTYYFSTAGLMGEAFAEAVAGGLTVGGEFYVSLAYRPLLARGAKVAVYPVQHFMQWGTPGDLAEYVRWSAAFRWLAEDGGRRARQGGTVMVPMAGLGKRFADRGFAVPKPLVPVSGRAMAEQAAGDLPEGRLVFVARRDLPGLDDMMGALPGEVVVLEGVTDGQARSCALGLRLAGVDLEAPLTIGACDNGMLYVGAAVERLFSGGWGGGSASPPPGPPLSGGGEGVDVVVWVVRGHPAARLHPEMFGWVAADPGGVVSRVSVKVPLADPASDPIVVGAFSFRRAGMFLKAFERMVERGAMVNGEFYVDTCINDAIALGYRCRVFEIGHYLGWGTPDDLATFEYWQSCFHKWPSHPYRLERDRRVPAGAMAALEARYGPPPIARPAAR